MQTKGIAFILDALLALTVAVIILTAVYSTGPRAQRDYFIEGQLTDFANDILVVLDKNESLSTLDADEIESVLEDILPDSYATEIKIYSYRYADSHTPPFSLEKTVTAKYPDASIPNEFVRAERSFVTFDAGEIDRYNIVDLRMWLR